MDSKTIVHMSLIFINVIVTVIINFFSFGRRRRNERNYQTNYDFYQKLVVDNITKLIGLTKSFGMLVNNLFEEVSGVSGKDDIRSIVEKACNDLDKEYDSFCSEILPVIKCYRPKFEEELSNSSEKLYDSTVIIITRITQSNNSTNQPILWAKFIQKKDSYLSDLFNLVEKYKPKLN